MCCRATLMHKLLKNIIFFFWQATVWGVEGFFTIFTAGRELV